MRKFLIALGFGFLALSTRAQAAVCTIPNVIANGAIVDATPVMQNFNALVSCANNIDWQNIDATGIFASQIIPTTPGQATFGGSVAYTFNTHVFFVASIVVDSTASPPATGIAGGNPNGTNGFWLTSNAGSSANEGFKFVMTATAMPSSNPFAKFTLSGTNLFEITTAGDGAFNGGVALDGDQPDGTSLIGGVGATPFFIKSGAGSMAGSNFVFLDDHDTIPAIIVENSGTGVIFEVDGVGDVQAKGAISADNNTPGPSGITGGTGTTSFKIDSNTTGATNAIKVQDINGSNTNFMAFINSSNTTVHLMDETGGESFGASGSTVVEPTSASFGGTVAVPTAGNNNAVCTNGSAQLIACSTSTLISLYNGGGLRSTGIIEYGNVSVSMSGTSGPNNCISGTSTVTLPQNMADSSYTVAMDPEGLWVMFGIQAKSSSGFTVYAGNPFASGCSGTQVVTLTWVAIGH